MQDRVEGTASPAGTGFRRPDLVALEPQQPGARQHPAAVLDRPAERHRLSVHPPGGPGDRALGRRLVREEPDLLRLREHREAGDRGRLQRRRLDVRRARVGGAEVRPQDPVHREDQPQRAADLPEQVRPDHVRRGRAGGRHGRGGGGRDDLLRLRRERAADRRGGAGVRPGPRAGHGHRAVVLPAQPEVQDRQGLPRQRRPHGPGQPPGRDDPGRHHQAEAAREQRRLQGAEHRRLELRQARRADLHRS